MNNLQILTVLRNHDVFSDRYMTEIRGYGRNGYKLLCLPGDTWVSGGRLVTPSGSGYKDHWDVIKWHGEKCKRKNCKCKSV